MCLRKDVSLPLTGDNMNTIKKSLKDRVWDYLIKNEKYIVPGILMIGGSVVVMDMNMNKLLQERV